MNRNQKMAYFTKRVRHWRKRLLIDPKISIGVKLKKADDLLEEGHEWDVPECLKQEELLVTHLERVLVGEKQWRKVQEILSADHNSSRMPLGECDSGRGEYWAFTIAAYPRLLEYQGKDFEMVADSVACHEVIHVMCWPCMSYTWNLEIKLGGK